MDIMDEKVNHLKKKYGGDFCWCEYMAIEEGITTPLHIYVAYNELELIKKALDNRADVNALDEDGDTPVFRAYNIETLMFLIENGADLNVKNKNGDTPLHDFSTYSSEPAKMLINHGADINAVNNDGFTPYDIACEYKNLMLMNHYKTLRAANGPVFNSLPQLHLAVIRDEFGSVKTLLSLGANPNQKSNGLTPIFWATSASVAELLIQNGADLEVKNGDGETPLLYLVSCFADEDDYKEMFEVVKSLVSNGADVNCIGANLCTPLHCCESVRIAELLVNNGADIEAVANDGYRPIHSAVESQYVDFAKVLLNASVDVNARTNEGKTAMHMLTCGADSDIIELLLSAGADINAVDNNGNTALHDLARFNHHENISFLIFKGATTSIRNTDGKTPLEIAIEKGHKQSIIALTTNNN